MRVKDIKVSYFSLPYAIDVLKIPADTEQVLSTILPSYLIVLR